MSVTVIQLFAKPPVEGKVKTRLVPDIGSKSAAAVYQHCLLSNINLIQNSAFDYQIWLTEPSDHKLFNNENIHYQQGRNLGERMFHALSEALSTGYNKAILMGSDLLDLTPSLLQKACDKLQRHDLLFIPALDGGYVLIAAKQTIEPEIFNGIDWGSNKVLRQTLEKAMSSGIDTVVLNPLRDIDRIDDLQHYAELQQYL